MDINQLLDNLWSQYVGLAPSAQKIQKLFLNEGEEIVNDHIAFRTFNSPNVNIDVMSKVFLDCGYIEKGQYTFKKKKLNAKHFEHATDRNAPKIFISELKLELCSEYLQGIVDDILASSNIDVIDNQMLPMQGRLWGTPSYAIYEKLREESEYAAWLYIYGFCPNHFTIFVNKLKKYTILADVNNLLIKHGFALNSSGGQIKGSPLQLLEQSSTLADNVPVKFTEGEFDVPSCYYEFAKRYEMKDGNLFQGFIASSADKIFESTDVKSA